MESSEVKISYKETDEHFSDSARQFHRSTSSLPFRQRVMSSRGSNVNKEHGATRAAIAETQKMVRELVSKPDKQITAYACKIDDASAPILDSKHVNFPGLKTVVEVVEGDTFDEAIKLSRLPPSTNQKPVCVLNFANATTAGGGWLQGRRAQEEQLFYRSTLSASLVQKRMRLYPMGTLEGIYSPKVYIFRENVESNYQFMEQHALVSVISMAAEENPPLSNDGSKYASSATGDTMRMKMRLILRAAGQMNHRRLALGAIGCGAFRHPPQEVANCWKTVLQESEFKGWFERIWFIIKDHQEPPNTPVFKEILHNLAK